MPPKGNLSEWIARRAVMHPERLALQAEDGVFTYAAFADEITRTAGALAADLDVGVGDRVAYLGHNSARALALFFAAARLGAVFMPMNWRLTPEEHSYVLRDAAPKVLVAQEGFVAGIDSIRTRLPPTRLVSVGSCREGWEPGAEIFAQASGISEGVDAHDAPVLLCYTSGTTGRPKGAMLRQEAIFYNAVNATHMHDLTGSDRVLSTLPLFHVGGLNIQTSPAFHAGASVFLHPTFDPGRTIAAIARERITLSVFVPAQFAALFSHKDWGQADLSSLRVISTGSTQVPRALIEKVHARGIPVIQVYGSTETAPIAAYQTADQAFATVGSTGRRALHCDVKIVDPSGRQTATNVSGEILVRGPNVFCEYWNDPEETRKAFVDGWFKTGDVGHFDEAGNLYIDDRIKDVIISGGENIYPTALEQILMECPDISETAIVARADERWGEVPVAVVVRKPGSDISQEFVIALFDGRIARYQHPKTVVFAEALPRNAMGKILKNEVRKLVGGGA